MDVGLSKAIEAELNTQQKNDRQQIRILLLGAGECGKSTILKQMKILHQGGFTAREKQEKKVLVRRNTLDALCAIITACKQFNISLEDEKADEWAKEILAFQQVYDENSTKEEVKQIGCKMIELFKNPLLEKVYAERSSEFFLLDSAPYFLNKIVATFAPDYVPDDQDIVRTRLATTGIIEENFSIEKREFKFYDVGGQRGERKKWIHSFDQVRAILFIASLSEYDQVLEEDRTKNRMMESLALYKSIVSLVWFQETPIILFLNKEDIFMEKIKRIDMGVYFPEYTGRCDPDLGILFIREQFMKQREELNCTIPQYIHLTNATDTTHFVAVWTFSKHIVLQKNLEKVGLVL